MNRNRTIYREEMKRLLKSSRNKTAWKKEDIYLLACYIESLESIYSRLLHQRMAYLRSNPIKKYVHKKKKGAVV